MEPIIIITAAPAGRGRFDASVDGRYILTSRSPFLDTARILAAQGADPATRIGLMHEGSDRIAMRSTIGIAAGLIVEEGDRLALRKHRSPGAVERSPAADSSSADVGTGQGEDNRP
jgi:hypothetical protein